MHFSKQFMVRWGHLRKESPPQNLYSSFRVNATAKAPSDIICKNRLRGGNQQN